MTSKPTNVFEEGSCQSSSDFDVSSISDLGSPLMLTRRLSPCGQDDENPYSPNGKLEMRSGIFSGQEQYTG